MAGRRLIKTTRHHTGFYGPKGRVYRTGKSTVQATTDETYAEGQARRKAARTSAGFPRKGSGGARKRSYSDATEHASALWRGSAKAQSRKRK